jgi:CRP-like cAMP-binding protein
LTAAHLSGGLQDEPESCLIQQFRSYGPLSGRDRDLLHSLETDERSYPRDARVYEQGERISSLYVVKAGWACIHHLLDDGRRQIVDIKLPGDVVGLREIAFTETLSGVATLTEATLCPFSKPRLTQVFERSPYLARLFFLIEARTQAGLAERIVNLGQRDAFSRLCSLLVELRLRLEICAGEQGETFRFPFSQRQLGDLLGLSEVHVNRTLRRLREEGLAAIAREQVAILDWQRLQAEARFNPATLELDLGWLRAE